MPPVAQLRLHDDTPREDHMVHLRGVSWEDYERLLEVRGDHSAPRFTYLRGTLEIMSPSKDHEAIKSLIASLLEVRSEEHTSELQSHSDLVCRLLLEKKKKTTEAHTTTHDQLNDR